MSYLPDEEKRTEDENEIASEEIRAQQSVSDDKELDSNTEGFYAKSDDLVDINLDDENNADSAYINNEYIDINLDDEDELYINEASSHDYDLDNDDPIDLSDKNLLGGNKGNKGNKGKKSFVKGLIYDVIFYAVLIVVCLYIIPNFVLQRTIVDGASMENTLKNNDQLYVEKISYRFDALKRFDIIVFYPYGRDQDDYYVKRIIGLPGEKIQIIGSEIYVNDELLEENYGKDPIEYPGRAAAPIYLAEDEYFVLGDNRSGSKDSRSSEVGNVKKDNIGGRVILRIYPFNKFGFVD